MDEREDRIRDRAYRLWEEEGRPDGRADAHWYRAAEILAIEEGEPPAEPVVEDTAVEPIEALASVGEVPSLTDQGETEFPHRGATDVGASVGAGGAPVVGRGKARGR